MDGDGNISQIKWCNPSDEEKGLKSTSLEKNGETLIMLSYFHHNANYQKP